MDKEKKKKIIDLIVKVALIIIIIILLITNCSLLKKNNGDKNIPGGNIDIIEIICDKKSCDNKPNQIESIRFAQNKISIKLGEKTNLVAIVNPVELSSSKLTWKSSDERIVTVDSNGIIKGIKIGKATITVTSSNGKTATCVVEVVNDAVQVSKINLSTDKSTIDTGSLTQISAVIEPENATNRDLIWSSSDESIATVDNNGIVKGIKNGTVTITAKTKDGKVVASITITVQEPFDANSFGVSDDEHGTMTWNGSNDLKIFTNTSYAMNDKIAPESSNLYQFVVKNETSYNLKYNINFIENNPYNINMKYKLKKNDTYIIDHYVSASELNVSNALLNVKKNDTYYLEWKWISSSNDTEIGTNPESKYGLKIDIKAESTNG